MFLSKSFVTLHHQVTQTNTTMINTAQKTQLEGFKAAKQIALFIQEGCYKRAKNANYCGAKFQGKMWVLGDSEQDIQKPDAYVFGKPAREIFGDFVVMKSN